MLGRLNSNCVFFKHETKIMNKEFYKDDTLNHIVIVPLQVFYQNFIHLKLYIDRAYHHLCKGNILNGGLEIQSYSEFADLSNLISGNV